MSDKAGWEVEGFIDRLTRRDDSNSERLVLEAIRHLRAFSRDCDALRDRNREMDTENERLQAVIRNFANPDNWSDQVGCLQWVGKRHAIEYAQSTLAEERSGGLR